MLNESTLVKSNSQGKEEISIEIIGAILHLHAFSKCSLLTDLLLYTLMFDKSLLTGCIEH